MFTDPIADFLTRIRNAVKADKESVRAPYSKLKEEIAKLLEAEAFIEKARVDRTGKFPEIVITFKDMPLSLNRISKPGRRVYKAYGDLHPIKNGYGISIISTSKGLMTGDQAKREGIGGELICEVF